MIIGADVTHPAPADKLETSVAACIGSIDADYSQYSGSIRAQERSTKAQAVEMIMDFEGMIKELLDEYRRAQGGLPNHIIYYRYALVLSFAVNLSLI
jgi:eukaryotic translation initiation factor 2C